MCSVTSNCYTTATRQDRGEWHLLGSAWAAELFAQLAKLSWSDVRDTCESSRYFSLTQKSAKITEYKAQRLLNIVTLTPGGGGTTAIHSFVLLSISSQNSIREIPKHRWKCDKHIRNVLQQSDDFQLFSASHKLAGCADSFLLLPRPPYGVRTSRAQHLSSAIFFCSVCATTAAAPRPADQWTRAHVTSIDARWQQCCYGNCHHNCWGLMCGINGFFLGGGQLEDWPELL